MVLQRAIRMVLQHDSNGLQRAIRMVLQRDSNGFAARDSNGFATRDSNGFAKRFEWSATRFEWLCNVIRMVSQRATRMVCNPTRMVLQRAIRMVLLHGSNGFEQQGYKVQSSKIRCFRFSRLGEHSEVPRAKRAFSAKVQT